MKLYDVCSAFICTPRDLQNKRTFSVRQRAFSKRPTTLTVSKILFANFIFTKKVKQIITLCIKLYIRRNLRCCYGDFNPQFCKLSLFKMAGVFLRVILALYGNSQGHGIKRRRWMPWIPKLIWTMHAVTERHYVCTYSCYLPTFFRPIQTVL